MRFRLIAHWPSKDMLPESEEHTTAHAANRRYRLLRRTGASSVSIFEVRGASLIRVYPTRLERYARAELRGTRRGRPPMRNTIASALLSMLASALPNSFGDFGVVSGWGVWRASKNIAGARTAVAGGQRRTAHSRAHSPGRELWPRGPGNCRGAASCLHSAAGSVARSHFSADAAVRTNMDRQP